MLNHKNNGACLLCGKIFDAYPGFHTGLRAWFEKLQAKFQDAHISCAGRGELDQNNAFFDETSRARFGQSAHNYNAAIDLFCNSGDDIYPKLWFDEVVGWSLPNSNMLMWYGEEGSPYYEMPHVEVKGWQSLVDAGELKLVK